MPSPNVHSVCPCASDEACTKVAVKTAPSLGFIGCIIIIITTTVIIIAHMMSPMQGSADYDPFSENEAEQARKLSLPWDLRGWTPADGEGALCPPESAVVS